ILQEVAKRSPEDLLWKITVTNHGPDDAPIHVLPHLWFRNIWTWGDERETPAVKPELRLEDGFIRVQHQGLPGYRFYAGSSDASVSPEWLFTENETNRRSIFGTENEIPYVKDAFHRSIIKG